MLLHPRELRSLESHSQTLIIETQSPLRSRSKNNPSNPSPQLTLLLGFVPLQALWEPTGCHSLVTDPYTVQEEQRTCSWPLGSPSKRVGAANLRKNKLLQKSRHLPSTVHLSWGSGAEVQQHAFHFQKAFQMFQTTEYLCCLPGCFTLSFHTMMCSVVDATLWKIDHQVPLFLEFSRQRSILEWVAISFSRGFSRLGGWTPVSSVSCIGRQIFFFFITVPPGKPLYFHF